MALFGKRRSQSVGPLGADIGFCAVDVATDGAVYVNQQHHREMEPEVVACVAALCWGISAYHVTLGRDGRSEADDIVNTLTQDWNPVDLNIRVNPGGLVPNNPPDVVHPPGLSAAANVRATTTGGAIAIWRNLQDFDADALLRGFAGLWLVADGHRVGDLVWHSLRALPEDPMRDPRTVEEALEQPMRLLEVAETARQATTSRATVSTEVAPPAPPVSQPDVEPAPEIGREPDPQPVAPSEDDSPSKRLHKAVSAINDLLEAGTITSQEAAHMRDRAMERFERSVIGGPGSRECD